MVIPNTHLYEVSTAMTGESYTIPSYYAFSDALTTVDVTDTTLADEFGSRIAATATRDNNIATFTGLRVGALVPTTGEIITGLGLLSASTAGILHTETVVPEIEHTDSFDIEFINSITYTRNS
jgi:hypothetical protein